MLGLVVPPAAIVYGEAAMGISNSMLLAQRRTTAAATAPPSGNAGQNLDLTLLIADGSPKGYTDPAYAAQTMPMGAWATAAWERWVPIMSLHRMVRRASKKKAGGARTPWSVFYGPAAALAASCSRFGWKLIDAAKMVTDKGLEINMMVDPPAAIESEVKAAVRRWRWRRVEGSLSGLVENGSGVGACAEPIWSLLNSKTWNVAGQSQDESPRKFPSLLGQSRGGSPRKALTRCTVDQTSLLKGSLKLTITNRQYPQVRVRAAGWSHHADGKKDLTDGFAEKGKQKAARRDVPTTAGRRSCRPLRLVPCIIVYGGVRG